MFPAAFSYLSAHSIDEALASLLEHGADARVLAGGQSLIPRCASGSRGPECSSTSTPSPS
jgi:CO/xanthine dehydrogenase FAD-binding subunit